ncbi:MAG: energy transducer TonB [Smithellaceae bacterium]|nr:energy transducer TonB [Smithellaceae bacterium]
MIDYRSMRAGNTSRIGLQKMVVISGAIHVVLLSLLFFLSQSLPTAKWTFGPVYSVQLVGTTAELDAGGHSSLISSELLKGGTSGHEMILEKSAEPLASLSAKKMDLAKSASPAIGKALEDLRRKLATSTQANVTGQRASLAGQAGASKELDRRMAEYAGYVRARIRGGWSCPPALTGGRNLTAVIAVRVSRNGTVTDIHYEKKSGNPYYDNSALLAVRKQIPFPPLPEGSGDSVEFGIRFP